MTTDKTPKGTQPNPPHDFETVYTVPGKMSGLVQLVRCTSCGTTKHRRVKA